MSHRLHAALVLAGLLALAAAPGGAASIDPVCQRCTLPSYVNVVGHDGAGHADASGHFVIVVRDLGNNPIAGVSVDLDFTSCPDVHLCLDQRDPRVRVHCSGGFQQVVSATTDALGQVEFTVLGEGANLGASSGPGAGCLNVLVGDMSARHVTVAVYDQDGHVGHPGVGITDLVSWLRDLGSGIYFGRSDYDHDERVSITDLSVLLRILGGGASSAACGTLPNPPGACN